MGEQVLEYGCYSDKICTGEVIPQTVCRKSSTNFYVATDRGSCHILRLVI